MDFSNRATTTTGGQRLLTLASSTSVHAVQSSQRRRALFSFAVDVAMAMVGVVASYVLASTFSASTGALGWTLLVVVLSITAIAVRGGYRFRLRVSVLDDVGRVMTGTAIAAMLVIAGREVLASGPDVASDSVRLWACLTVSLGCGRMGLGLLNSRSSGLSTLVIGAGQVGRIIARRLDERPELGLTPVGFLDEDPLEDGANQGPPVLGAIPDLEEVVRQFGVEHVVVAFSRAPHHVLLGLVRRCRALGIEVSLVPRLFEEVSGRVTVEHLGSVALLRVDRADPRGWQFDLKYLIDRVVSAVVLIILAPLLLVIAALVKASSPGPVFFRQPRIGLDGKEFDLFKFRTMRNDVEAPEHDAAWAIRALGHEPKESGVIDATDRRTPIGKFLRAYSLDELPQFLNVLQGNMSLVGPRPERTGYVHVFGSHIYRYDDRHRVKSGLTGWAQIHGLRGETSLDERGEWDNFYVENWSPLLDLKILLRTPFAVLEGSRER